MARRLTDDFDLFIFDWDGTLITMRFLRRASEWLNTTFKPMVRLANRMGYGTYADSKKAIKKGRNKTEIRKNWFEPFRAFLDLLMNYVRPKLQYDVMETLDELKKRKKLLAIFSDGYAHRIIKESEYLKIEGYFDMMVSAKMLKAMKPDPLGLDEIIKLLKIDRKRVLYIGDMTLDVETARNAGVKVCAISAGFNDYAALKREEPDYLMRSMEEFRKRL